MSKTYLVSEFFKMKANFFRVDLFEDSGTIPRSEFFLMHHIEMSQNKKEHASVSQLAKLLKISNPAVSKTVKSLVEKQWVARSEDCDDRRNAWLELTDQGQVEYQRVVNLVNELFEAAFEQFDQAEIEQFIETGNRIAQTMKDLKEGHKAKQLISNKGVTE